MTNQPKYPAKVLLFGEHTILRGSRALAIPLWQRASYWKTTDRPQRHAGLLQFAEYLDYEFPHLFYTRRMRDDLAAGYYLASDIPTGYGLGSSGAVCVAVFDRYATATAKRKVQMLDAKAFFAQMETFFHGASSGTDPLIIYLQQSVELLTNGQFEPLTLPVLQDDWQFFLLDTKQPRQTAPLVSYFTERYDTDESFQHITDTLWTTPNNQAIDALKAQDMLRLASAFRQISQFQFDHLAPMVLSSIRDSWQQGLISGDYLLKICGAGGGGFCLGLTQNWIQTSKQLAHSFPLLKLSI